MQGGLGVLFPCFSAVIKLTFNTCDPISEETGALRVGWLQTCDSVSKASLYKRFTGL